MSLFKTFSTDHNAEAKGIWLDDFPKNTDGTVPGFLIARQSKSNTKFAKAAEAIGKKFRRQINLDILSEELADPAVKELFLTTVLLDWRNVFDADDKPLPYSKENAAKLIELLPDLYEYLDGESKKMANFREADLKDDAGN